MARRITTGEVSQLKLTAAQLGVDAELELAGAVLAGASRTACALLAARYPGGTVELRVPPYAAVQLGLGERGRHTRGTPPNVVQTDARTLLRLAGGTLTWSEAVSTRLVQASGILTDLDQLWPLPELR